MDHRRYLATIPNHQRNLWRIRNHLKKVKKKKKKKNHDADYDALIRTVNVNVRYFLKVQLNSMNKAPFILSWVE